MDQFWFYFKLGLNHVLDINAYDHILFFIALTVPYTFSNWKKILWLVTMFTVGHTVSLILATYGVVSVSSNLVECLIPVIVASSSNKMIPLLEFALGIEASQIIVVLIVLILGFICQSIFRFNKRDWIMVISSIVVGFVIPMLINSCAFS